MAIHADSNSWPARSRAARNARKSSFPLRRERSLKSEFDVPPGPQPAKSAPPPTVAMLPTSQPIQSDLLQKHNRHEPHNFPTAASPLASRIATIDSVGGHRFCGRRLRRRWPQSPRDRVPLVLEPGRRSRKRQTARPRQALTLVAKPSTTSTIAAPQSPLAPTARVK
jgi:hypothetical protein